jgi:hypothetical protein
MTGAKPKDKTGDGFGYVYLIHNPRTGFFKIGSARKPRTRLTTLSREMCTRCVMLHTIATNALLRLERECQRRFLEQHQGGEWFDLTSVDVALICSVSTVFYRDAAEQPRSRLRLAFDAGAKWAAGLPVCGAA